MENFYLNDEQKAILEELRGCAASEKIEILKRSIEAEENEISRKTLEGVLLELENA